MFTIRKCIDYRQILPSHSRTRSLLSLSQQRVSHLPNSNTRFWQGCRTIAITCRLLMRTEMGQMPMCQWLVKPHIHLHKTARKCFKWLCHVSKLEKKCDLHLLQLWINKLQSIHAMSYCAAMKNTWTHSHIMGSRCIGGKKKGRYCVPFTS